MEENRPGAGGTPGGIGTFIIGLFMALTGAYLLTNQIHVATYFWGHRWGLWGGLSVTPFGITLIPLIIGIGMIFFNGRSKIGWALTIITLLFIIVGVIANLQVYFAPTTLYVTVIILVLLVGGLGLILRSLRPMR